MARRPPRPLPWRRLVWACVAALAVATGAPARAEDERPTLVRALFLEKTSRDPKAALEVYRRVAEDAATDDVTRAEARLGAARCLMGLGRDAEADEVWRVLEADASAPPGARDEARARRRERAAAARTAADAEAEARAQEVLRRAEQAREDRERRAQAAKTLVASAQGHVREKRYERAREDLIQALQLNPADEQAAALLDEVSSFGDRGDLLRQAIRFVATNRIVDFRRLAADVERRHKAAIRLVREGKPDLAAASLSEALRRIDESDFFADLAEPRREMLVLLKKAVDDTKAAGVALPAGTTVPADRPDAPAVKPWRSEFFALLARIFSADDGGDTALRFYDATVPPNPTPDAQGSGFASTGIGAQRADGTLRRARWIERYVRENVAVGSWSGRERLLERYDDLLVVEHAAGVLREVDGIVGAFPAAAPAPVRVELRVYAAAPGGVADVIRLLEVRAKPGESGTSAVVRAPGLATQEKFFAGTPSLRLLAQATTRLTAHRRHAALVRFREPTAGCPWYAETGGPTPLVIADRDATYGLDVDLFAEDLPGAKGYAAVSAVATVRRPERPRTLPLASGNTRVPSFLTQVVEADQRVPHSGSLVLFSLANPFKETGAAGDAAGGTHPDLVVLVSVVPADPARLPDVPVPPVASGEPPTREIELGPLADIEDEPPPDDWPSAPFADASRLDAARRRRDAFLAGWFADRVVAPRGSGTLVVRDGRVTAALPEAAQDRLVEAISQLSADAGRLFTVEVRASELAADRGAAALAAAGVVATDAAQRVWRLDEAAAARLEERLVDPTAPASLFNATGRLAARHTQLVTMRSIRARSLVEEFRVEQGPGGTMRTVPVNGTVEEGLVVSVRPVASVGGLATLDVAAVLARVERTESWSPPDAPGGAPAVALPRHRVERAGGHGTFGPKDTILLAIPSPGSDGARTVLVRVRHVAP